MNRSADGFSANPGSSPTDALQLILAAAAFDRTAQASRTWAPPSEQETATAMFTGLAELLRIELSDPTWSTQEATLEAVSLVSQAYASAANTVRRTDPAAELGHGEIKQQGCDYAADWLQAQADTLALIAAELGGRLPAAEHQGRARFQPDSVNWYPTVEFATLVVVQDDQIDVTIHENEAAANAYYREHFRDGDSDHRIDVHTHRVSEDRDLQEWLSNGPHVELVTLVVVQDRQIDLTVHGNEYAASSDLEKRFPARTRPPSIRYRIHSHRVAVCE